MKALVLALLLLPLTAIAQYEDHPDQQRLWELMQNVAPSYEMLSACGRDYTAGLVYDDVKNAIAAIVQDRRDIDIAMQMWSEAKMRAAVQYHDTIRTLSRNPDGKLCNDLENEVIQIMGAGV